MGHSTSSGRGAANTTPSNERIQRENLSREDAQNVAEELRTYGYEVSITGEGDRRTVTAERRAALDSNRRRRR